MIFTAEQIAFWLCIGVLGYVYVGYPLLVHLVSRMFPKPVANGEIEPKVTVLITAFNEENDIRAKLENTLSVEYPAHKLEIIVASDGSTDGTDEIVKTFADRGVTLFRQEGRVGKTTTQNNAVEQATGDIILFSDATTLYTTDVFRRILPHFADETVGCVAGRLIYVDDASTIVGSGAKSYWNYETFIKTAESTACSLIGASGCLYAVRRSAYEPMYAEACSDFLICTNLYRNGLRSIFAPDAVCYEHTNSRSDDELSMRVRVISQTFTDLWRNRDMLNPLKSGFFAVQLISHKVLRYTVPFLLLALLVTNAILASQSVFYAGTFALQSLFYVLALVGWIMERAGHRLSILAMPLYFVLANLASAVAFYKFLRGERYARWEPIRSSR
ncbi:MAG: glycosyltransferase family 2 protein [Chloracidobacterium sp.]|nr:glycosyltransferase family 2 protein [Chloracidobacterium sp.]